MCGNDRGPGVHAETHAQAGEPCDGDRREFARNQAEGLKTRLEKGEKRTECTIEEPCTDNILGAAVAGTSGFTTAEKFEKMGRPELADAPNSSKPNLGF